MPAIKADNPNIIILTRTLLIPTAAAALSLLRTANITRPEPLRRMLATIKHKIVRTANKKKANTGRDVLLPYTNPKFQSPNDGLGIFGPPVSMPPITHGCLKTNSAMVTPPARVTIAKLVPLTRKAGSPTKTPNNIAPRDARIGANGKGIP